MKAILPGSGTPQGLQAGSPGQLSSNPDVTGPPRISDLAQPTMGPKPAWLRKALIHGDSEVRRTIRRLGLHTVCEEARCPNRHECWGAEKTATFLVLGDRCTRNCRFCNVAAGKPLAPDPDEPARVAEAIQALNLSYVVITMSTRDDLADGGAAHMADVVRAIRRGVPHCRVEVLPSDFGGRRESVVALAAVAPEVYGHNIETVRRMTALIRSAADYERSLMVLRWARENAPNAATKSAMMVGLGETWQEVLETMDDLRQVGVDLLVIGQYLRPTRLQVPVQRYWTPDEFARLREEALGRGFVACEAGPWVRSSYRADGMYEVWRNARGFIQTHASTSEFLLPPEST